MKLKRIFLLSLCAVLLTHCGAIHKSIKYSTLDVQTKMSSTVFLTPVGVEDKTVLVQVRNTSDKQNISCEEELMAALSSKGYRIVQSPSEAHYILQANILSIGRVREGDGFQALGGGFGASLTGAFAGGAAGALIGGTDSTGSMLAGGLIGGLVGTAADAMVEVMTFNMVTDIQISERAQGSIVTQESHHSLSQGTSGATSSRFEEKTDRKTYQTRIVSSAQQVNLKFEEALPELKKGLIQSLSGIL